MLRHGHRRTGVFWLSLLILVLPLALSGAASATVWKDGDLITWTQGAWGDIPTTTNAAGLLNDNYDTVYASTGGIFEVGIPGTAGFSMVFTTAANLLDYLPSAGTAAPLDSDLGNPTTSPSGIFGGDVAALKINIDFSDAGFLTGNSGLKFGDLTVSNLTSDTDLNGLTIRQILGIANTALGGGTVADSISDIDFIAANLNASFGGGGVSTWAQDHLNAPSTAVPEPTTMLLLGSGLIGLAGYGRKKFFKK